MKERRMLWHVGWRLAPYRDPILLAQVPTGWKGRCRCDKWVEDVPHLSHPALHYHIKLVLPYENVLG